MTTRTNTFETRIFGHTFTGRAHSVSAWFVLGLQLTMGHAFLHAGYVKVVEVGWGASGYLANVAAANGNPCRDFRVDGRDPVVRRVRQRGRPVE